MFPVDLKEAIGYVWKAFWLMHRAIVRGARIPKHVRREFCGRIHHLLRQEKEHGRIMLAVRTIQGVIEVEPLVRELCEDV